MKEEQISVAKTKVAVLQTRLMSDQDWQESGQDVDCMSLGDETYLNASQRPVRMRDDRMIDGVAVVAPAATLLLLYETSVLQHFYVLICRLPI